MHFIVLLVEGLSNQKQPDGSLRLLVFGTLYLL